MLAPLTQRNFGHLARNAKSGFLSTLFVGFPGRATNFVWSAGSTLFEDFLEIRRKTRTKKVPKWGPEKVLESACLAGRSRPRLGSPNHVLAQTRFPSWAQNIKNGPTCVQNRRFGLKIGPRESCGHFGPVRTGPGPKKSKSMPKNRQV